MTRNTSPHMKITFGLHLNGWRSAGSVVRFDEAVCGVHGFLRTLELALGLPTPEATRAKRVIGYRAALARAAAIQQRFYQESFAKDGLATSEELLRWRDELIMAGWDGASGKDDRERLQDMVAVEALVASDVKCGPGDRIRTILGEMVDRPLGELEVSALDSPDHLPHLLRVLLEALQARFIGAPEFPLAAAGTNLRRLQDNVVDGLATPFVWNVGDDSVALCSAFSEVTLARAAAYWLHDGGKAAQGSVVVSQGSLRQLRESVALLDAPMPAASEISVERPALQVLQLALRLRWAPLNPRHVLEFLTHPLNPLPAYLRFQLADAVAEQPGIGGPRWCKALAGALEKDEKYLGGGDKDPIQEKINRLIESWIEIERFDTGTGAPGAALATTCDLVAEWARRRAATSENLNLQSHLLIASAQASELAEILRPEERVSAPQLGRLLRLVQETGIPDGGAESELGAVPCYHDPGALIEPADEVYWWGFERAGSPRGAPWTRQEREGLAARGVFLQTAAVLHEEQQASAVLPVLAARKRLRLFLPKSREGESVQHHPLLDRLHAMVEEAKSIPALQIDSLLADDGGGLGTIKSPRRPLPPLRRWWHLEKAELLAPRAKESFSSLERFVDQPFAWVLDYKARLKPGASSQFHIVADQRQKGTLLHRLVEHLFDEQATIDWRSASREEFSAWLAQQWQQLLSTEAANLLLPGNQAACQSLHDESRRALWQLIGHLRHAGIIRARADVRPTETSFAKGVMVGNIDLLVEKADGSKGVVDLKYGGRDRRQKELKDNLQLQLAVYGNLVAAESKGKWPEAAYFILKDVRLLAQDTAFFGDANVVAVSDSVSTPGLKACWGDFLDVWKWRRTQLDLGWIELPLDGADPAGAQSGAPASEPPHTHWTPEDIKPENRYDDFVALTGWRDSA